MQLFNSRTHSRLQPRPILTPSPGANEENVPYGSANGTALLLDIYRPPEPTDKSRPAVILIQGGG